jgi:hypothetical protein
MELKERQSPEAEGANLTMYAQCAHRPFSTAKRETGEGLTGFEHLSRQRQKDQTNTGTRFSPRKRSALTTCIHERRPADQFS